MQQVSSFKILRPIIHTCILDIGNLNQSRLC